MICPACDTKIGFIESLTVMNPLSFKCHKCNNYLSLARSSIRAYIIILCVIAVISFTGFYILSANGLLNRNLLVALIPLILLAVFLIHYFYWDHAIAVRKDDKMSDITNLGC